MSYDKLKKGDKIIVELAKNGAPTGVPLEIVAPYPQYYSVTNKKNGAFYNVYFSGNYIDEFHLVDRKAKLEYLKEKLVELQKEEKCVLTEIDMLENYKTEEDYVAYKLHKILSVKDDEQAIAKILKELKQTHYL